MDLRQFSFGEDHVVASHHSRGSGVQTYGPVLLCSIQDCSNYYCTQLEKHLQDCLIQSIMVNWWILLLRSHFHTWARLPCHSVLESTALLKTEVNSRGDSHSGAAIHTVSSSASQAWLGNANNKQTIITHNCGSTQPLMTLFNTASALWRTSSLRSHAPRSISRLALPTVIPTAHSNCFASTA